MFTQIANHDAALLCVSVILLNIQCNNDMGFILQPPYYFFWRLLVSTCNKYLFPGYSGSNYNDIAIWGLLGKISTDESRLLSTSCNLKITPVKCFTFLFFFCLCNCILIFEGASKRLRVEKN